MKLEIGQQLKWLETSVAANKGDVFQVVEEETIRIPSEGGSLPPGEHVFTKLQKVDSKGKLSKTGRRFGIPKNELNGLIDNKSVKIIEH